MGTPSCLMRPRPAPFANFELPTLHAGEGLGSKLAPPSVGGTKGTCHRNLFPLFICCEEIEPRCGHLGPCGGALARCYPPFSHMPPISDAPPGSYTLKGQSFNKAAAAHIPGLCASTACPYMLRPAPSRSKGLSH